MAHRHVTEAIEKALQEISEREGQLGFRQPYDKALYIQVALAEAGLKIVRSSKKPARTE